MRARILQHLILKRLADYPAVLLVGPRQCGKTTLARSLGQHYLDLEQPGDRLRLDADWPAITTQPGLTILDEAQCWPELFPRLRGTIDAQRDRPGRFLLLGSVAPALMRQVADSLAGRLAIIDLAPFCLGELPDDQMDRLWLCGGFPDGGVLADGRFPHWQHDYLRLLAARDLPQWGLNAKPQVTDRLMAMIAALHGQQWNASQIGQGLGLSYHTIESYADVLEGACLLHRLPAFAGNLAKRLVKRPKMYWRDSGLLHSLLDVRDHEDLLRRPWVGASWEGFVVTQIHDRLSAEGQPCPMCYLRTSDGIEADLVLERPDGLWVIEVKLTSAPSQDDLNRARRAAQLIGAKQTVVVSRMPGIIEAPDTLCCPLPELLRRISVRS